MRLINAHLNHQIKPLIIKTMQYAKNEKQAIRMAKNQIKKEFNLSRISEHLIKYKSCSCGCGESPAIELVTFLNKEQQFTQVGICQSCS